MLDLLFNEEEDVRVLAASVLGVCLTYTDDVTEEDHGRCVALGQLLKYNGERCAPYHAAIIHNVTAYLKNDNLMTRKAAISVCKYVLNSFNGMTEENKVVMGVRREA